MDSLPPSRRRLLSIAGKIGLTGLCACTFGRITWAAASPLGSVRGCVLHANQAGEFIDGSLVLGSSGIPRVDHAIAQEIKSLKSTFGVDATFAFINDREGENAYAFSSKKMTKPMVVFGIRLMHRVIGSSSPIENGPIPARFPSATAGTLAGVLAHEWAHILQFERNIKSNEATVRPLELHADFLAGWYMGTKNLSTSDDLADLEQDFRSLGDNMFTAPDHHGTAKERADALLSGYQLSKSANGGIEFALQKGASKYGLTYA